MSEVLTIIAIAAGAFIGTNLDNMVLLVAFYSRFQQHPRMVTAGYIGGMILIAGICFLIGKGGQFIPLSYLGMLGVVPIVMGIVALVQLFISPQTGQSDNFSIHSGPKTVFMAVLMTQLSNGADSIITFSVFLADSSNLADYLIATTIIGMSCLYAWLAYYSLKHPRLSEVMDRVGRYLTPFILIFVGVYILMNTSTDLMPG